MCYFLNFFFLFQMTTVLFLFFLDVYHQKHKFNLATDVARVLKSLSIIQLSIYNVSLANDLVMRYITFMAYLLSRKHLQSFMQYTFLTNPFGCPQGRQRFFGMMSVCRLLVLGLCYVQCSSTGLIQSPILIKFYLFNFFFSKQNLKVLVNVLKQKVLITNSKQKLLLSQW